MEIQRRGMPAELMNELFASIPLENAFGLLTKMANGLLARNVQKMLNGIKEIMKNNKLNEDDCGPKLSISEEGIEVKHSVQFAFNSVRAFQPIPTFILKAINKSIAYFEVQFFSKFLNDGYSFMIGFCDQQFQLEKRMLGFDNNISIGIGFNRGIWIDGSYKKLENIEDEYYSDGDIVGCGIIHHPNGKMECFATCNGKFMGKTKLSTKFANIQIFPAITMYDIGVLIRVNFGKDKWQFEEFGYVLGMRKKGNDYK